MSLALTMQRMEESLRVQMVVQDGSVPGVGFSTLNTRLSTDLIGLICV